MVFVATGPLVHAQPKGADELERRVQRALAYLKDNQQSDGAWKAQEMNSPAVTGLALMAFLSAGHVPGEGPYRATLDKGIRWLLKQQKPNGIIDDDAGSFQMYNHGICTLLLAEVAGMTDAQLGKECKQALEKAVAVILRAQAKSSGAKGGWRYRADSDDADMSVTGWQLLALRAAKNAGCDVPAERIDRALAYVLSCREPGAAGGFGYTPGQGMTLACTGTAILCLEICGNDRSRGRPAVVAGSVLLKHGVNWGSDYFFYSVYYGAQAAFQLGNNFWNVYRPQLHKELFANQQKDGEWTGPDGFGPDYATAMAVLALTVEYRLLPIYQRHEEPEKGKTK